MHHPWTFFSKFFFIFFENELDIWKLNNEELWRYYNKQPNAKKKQCYSLKIATCETFLKTTEISSLKKNSKTMHPKKNATNKNVLELPLTFPYRISHF